MWSIKRLRSDRTNIGLFVISSHVHSNVTLILLLYSRGDWGQRKNRFSTWCLWKYDFYKIPYLCIHHIKALSLSVCQCKMFIKKLIHIQLARTWLCDLTSFVYCTRISTSDRQGKAVLFISHISYIKQLNVFHTSNATPTSIDKQQLGTAEQSRQKFKVAEKNDQNEHWQHLKAWTEKKK